MGVLLRSLAPLCVVLQLAAADNFISFYVDSGCKQRSGGVGYSTGNGGCFNNAAAYVSYGGPVGADDWHLEQWTSDQCTDSRNACANAGSFIAQQATDTNPCVKLDDLGFNSGFGSYRIEPHGC